MPKSRTRQRSDGRARRLKAGRPRHRWLNLPAGSLPSLAFPADLLGLEGPEHTRVEIDLVVTGPDGAELHRLPLRLTRRLRSHGKAELWGSDKHQLLAVQIVGTDDGNWTLLSRVTATGFTGGQLLRILDLVEALQPPNAVALAAPDGPGHQPSPLRRPAVNTPPPAGLREIVEAQASIERSLGTDLPVPEKYTAHQHKDLFATAALLRGETVVDNWERLDWPMTVAEARALVGGIFADNGQATLEYEREWTLRLGDRKLRIGIVLAEYEAARLVPVELTGRDDDEDINLRLTPGDVDLVRFRLIEGVAPEPDGEDGSAAGQDWFWTPEWQEREREVDAEVERGRVTVHGDADAFLDHLDGLARNPE